MRADFQGTSSSGQGPGRRPSPRSSSIPAYILFPAGFFGGSIVFTYWYFQDEAPFTKRKRLLATVSSCLCEMWVTRFVILFYSVRSLASYGG